MGGKSAPQAPDYNDAAREQAASSAALTAQQNWANRPQQYTPWGRTEWQTYQDIDPGTGQPVTKWVQSENLNPQLQQALDKQISMQNDRSDLAASFTDRLQADMGQSFDWGKIDRDTPAAGRVDARAYITGTQPMQNYVQQEAMDTSAPQQITTGREQLGITGQDTQGLQQTTGTTNAANFSADRQRIEQSLFDRMQPEHDRATAQLRTQLANQGITPGSESYNQQMQALSDNQARERFNAVQQGGQEQQGLQSMLMGQQQQAFGQGQASQQARNQALQNLFGQQQGAAQFGLGAGQQGFAQDLASQEAQNAARTAQFQQAMNAGNFYNTAGMNTYQQQLGVDNQNYQQAMSSTGLQTQLRQQKIAEEAQRRSMSLNEMNALMSGQQVQTPQMPGFQTAVGSQPVQSLSAAQMTGQSMMDQFNAQQQQTQGMMSGAMGLGSKAAMM